MSKAKKGVDYSKVTPALVKQVKEVIADGDRHNYSVSKVYAAYNEAYGLRENPQTCSSCLRTRVRLLKDWLKGYEAQAKPVKREEKPKGTDGNPCEGKGQDGPENVVIPQYDDPTSPGFVAPATGVVRTPMAEGLPLDFTPGDKDPNKGTVLFADGTAVRPGTYKTARGIDIAVQVGGKATIKTEVDNPDELL